ncbi:hypothetical protein FHS39_004783 [Streptomyces olivoverticillatus]|uniref:non-specific serine/threonine protein kinase n=1 Tax=Streptomyces olivoverticillatus TaxID=66427 RepID=A0A7W7LSK4_9ACTN|nr:serine/threonine-protein kinase [Streptomyces olivoverticillatus]MBB4895704.1 hypothetical protein [Streptomyces olivoverticillatus]
MRMLGVDGPTHVGPFRTVGVLGQGGMGQVLLGVAPDGRLVAVKRVHADLAEDPGFRSRFRREVDASRRVSGAYTAPVVDADPNAPTPWLASLYLPGPTLSEALDAGGALPEETVLLLAAGLAQALDDIHRAGLVHRDLKPSNVLLTEEGARVIDFGIARAAETGDATELTGTGWVIGSPPFMSPEQAQSRELTGASDVFSLGSVLVMAATGRSPFSGPSALQTLYNVVHAEPDLNGVPQSLYGIVARCLAKNPADRPTPAELLALLGPVAPAARPWPAAVHRMVDEQRARVDGLLDGDPERTALLRDAAPAAPRTAVLTTYDAAAAPPRHRRPMTWVTVGAVLAAAIGVGTYLLLRDGDGSGGPPDKYVTMPVCPEAVPKLPLREERRKDKDISRENTDDATTECSWFGKDQPQPDGWNFYASADVTWELRRSGPQTNGTEKQRKEFAGSAKGERRAAGLGFGDEAYWSTPASASATGRKICQLNVRDGNLVIRVYLDGTVHPNCEAEALDITKAALAAMPR